MKKKKKMESTKKKREKFIFHGFSSILSGVYVSQHHLLSFRMQLHAKSFHIKRQMNRFYKINGGMYAGVLKKQIFNIYIYKRMLNKFANENSPHAVQC